MEQQTYIDIVGH